MRINLEKIHILLLWVLITSVAPFAFFVLPWHPYKIVTFTFLLILIAFILAKRKIKFVHPDILIIILFQIICYAGFAIYHKDVGYINLIIQNISIIITFYFILLYISIETFIKQFILIIKIMGFLGTFVFIYALLGGKYYNVFKFIDGRDIFNYILSFAKSPFSIGNGTLIRVCGYFDEPGTFAFFIIQALLLNKLVLNNRKNEIVLIIIGLFTLSVAFFISVLFYLILFYFTFKKLMYLLLAIFIGVILIVHIDKSKNKSFFYHKVYEQTIARVEGLLNGAEKGEIVANNRKDLIERAIVAFKDAPMLGHGLTKVPKKYGYFGANIFGSLANHGIIGFIIVFLPIIVLVIYSAKIPGILGINSFNKASLILLINYLQRPDVTGLLIYLLLIAFIVLTKEKFIFKPEVKHAK